MPIIIEQLNHPSLVLPSLSIKKAETWSIYGRNNSGTDTLLQILTGTDDTGSSKNLKLPENIGFLTTRKQQELFEQELANDNSDFLEYPDPGTLVREFLPNWADNLELIQALDMERCLDKGFRQLSSGQNRKLLLLKELLNDADYLILENPFDGLDTKSYREVNKALQLKSLSKRTLLLFINNRHDIPKWCSHLLFLSQGNVFFQGEKKSPDILESLLHSMQEREQQQGGFSFPKREKKKELILLQDGFAGYSGRLLFSGVNLKVESGEHTLVTGCNGCGKSTLFDIITGDNPKCYSNKLSLFGKKRGSGESIWEIKNKMGIVSPDLHRNHRAVGSALQVVLSGLFDSIGLYAKATPAEIAQAKKWLMWTGLQEVAQTPFRNLDYGKQRLILIARALVKEPELLMLDEPTQGLDDYHREQLLNFLEYVAQEKGTTIFYISHRKDEYRSFFRQRLRLEKYLTH